MAEAFVKIIKGDYASAKPRPNEKAVLRQFGGRFEHYNEHRPHKALRYLSPRQFRRINLTTTPCPIF